VIGAGITGSGVARAAAERGLSVALVEAGDIASGTSSRSSKMIHGGVRYLAQGDVGLVREAASERQILRRIAPHLARISAFVLPVRSIGGMAKFRAAMWAFEKLGRVPQGERHAVWSAAELAEREPLAAVDAVTGAVQYYEFLTDDSRLTLANARSARAAGAAVLTYAPVTEILLEGGKAVGVVCEGALEGENERCVIRGRMIVNAAGPWVDAIRALEDANSSPRLALTKGIHVVVPHARLPIRNTLLMSAADKRPVFAVPRGSVTYLGTTDNFHPETSHWPGIEWNDIAYLFEAAADSFATDPLEARDICALWSGVRPLVAQEGKSPSEISRRDEIWDGPGGVLSIAGGKLTAYRLMAERIVDSLVKRLGRHGMPPSRTHETPLVGGDFDSTTLRAALASSGPQRERLFDLYGSEALDVARDGADLAAEVRQAVLREGALHLEDYWVRRSGRAWFEVDAGLPSLQPAADEMARLLGWDDTMRKAEVEACQRIHEESIACLAGRRGRAS
jgi:glycerol-3-phosphate dehydrogenase